MLAAVPAAVGVTLTPVLACCPILKNRVALLPIGRQPLWFIIIRVAEVLFGVVGASILYQAAGVLHVLLWTWVCGLAHTFASVSTLPMIAGRLLFVGDGLLTVVRANGLDHVVDVVELWFTHHGGVSSVLVRSTSVVVGAASMLMRAASLLSTISPRMWALEGEVSDLVAVPAAPFFFRA